MNKAELALKEIQSMNELAQRSSIIHGLAPLSKIIVTIAYIIVTLSFPIYDFSGLVIFIFYPVIAYQMSEISIRTCFYKLRIVLPLVMAVGLFNPFFDKTPFFTLGNICITGGMISMITLMTKGVLCLMASFLLIATTTIEEICYGFRQLHVPKIITSLMLLTYRYVSLLLEEVDIMTTAYHLRAPGQKGIHYKAWGSFLGELLIRTMDRATAIYESMELRGYHGEFYYVTKTYPVKKSIIYSVIWLIIFFVFRKWNITVLVGGLFV